MTGFIYCITNSYYKIDDVYKLGYTAKNTSYELTKHHLLQRYGTYFPNVECICLFEVRQPIQAEQHLFELLKDYKYKNEFYKADFNNVIKIELDKIQNIYLITNEQILSEQQKLKYKKKLLNKINYITKRCYEIKNYLLQISNSVNSLNSNYIHNIHNSLSYYDSLCYSSDNKSILKNYKNNLISELTALIQKLDYGDLEIIKFIDFINN